MIPAEHDEQEQIIGLQRKLPAKTLLLHIL